MNEQKELIIVFLTGGRAGAELLILYVMLVLISHTVREAGRDIMTRHCG